MAISITTALYKKNDEVREVSTFEIDGKANREEYKGNLYCTTPGCNARLVYVYRTGKPSYFRTWKKDDHLESCIYSFERIEGRIGINTQYSINVEISAERKRNALQSAYKQFKMPEERRVNKKTPSRKSRKTKGRTGNIAIKPVIQKGATEEEVKTEGRRGPNLLRRNADALSDSDVGKARLIIGFIKRINYDTTRAVITIENNNHTVDVKFEEAFFANSPRHIGFFHFIERYITENTSVIFTAVGEVRKTSNGNKYEFVVYDGEDFRIENMTLLSIAAYYSHNKLE
ncbi:hypothetical protein ABE218_10350 [Bacillus smithii]|uniref:hypothetical protein n=1 Tax=Bacillus smithii TaxID=1479 RepID=UPI003D1D0349